MKKLEDCCVLVLEANAHVRTMLRAMLAAFPVADIHEAATTEQGLKLVNRRPFDLVLADALPGRLTGIDFTRLVRRNARCINRTVPIVMLSALPDEAGIACMRDAGVHEVLIKPVVARELYLRLLACLDRRREFIISEGYVGPCRRRRALQYPPELERRKDKLAERARRAGAARSAH